MHTCPDCEVKCDCQDGELDELMCTHCPEEDDDDDDPYDDDDDGTFDDDED